METWSDEDFSSDTKGITQHKGSRTPLRKKRSDNARETASLPYNDTCVTNQDVTSEEPTISTPAREPQPQHSCTSIGEEICCPLCKQNLLDFSLEEREAHVNQCLDSCFTPPASPKLSHIQVKQEIDAFSVQSENQPGAPKTKPESSTAAPTKHEQITLWKKLLDGNSRRSASNAGDVAGKRSLYHESQPLEKKIKSENDGDKGTRKRGCPFYKKLPNTKFTVDAFSYGKIEDCTGYFLSHYHSDHYRGITKGFNHGPIYCSSVTGNLLRLHIGVSEDMIVRLPFNQEVDIQGIKVVLLDANHCPGSAVFLFKLPNGTNYLHTGDFRASKELALNPFLRASQEPGAGFNRSYIDHLYLDTTYCKEQYRFPSQPEVIQYVSDLMRKRFRENPKVLIAVGTYLIGKERIVLGIANAIEKKIFGDARKRGTLSRLEWPELQGLLTTEPACTNVHIVPMRSLNPGILGKYLKEHAPHFNAIIGIRPTGWAFKGSGLHDIKPRTYGNISIYEVPYSEHSSYLELQEFVQIIRPRKIIPTVNVHSEKSRREMNEIFHKWTIENPYFNKTDG
ncbi:DRMBL-domain-containing protein [Basidiobolus meristosporus CBS 931.73]|uniref:DRMBL-domain-containing protein n=1 Tax=Basidiobolus meristosporus CBS 931.73 TaxID=1314790 RepID=A0A1Y1YGV7_9FUNG|nr:DRMBL-domain-containing protein [Basidiobolus meristosporus CBS 931.73]|eukprot:ORX97188.1 DRMBL-domain-containing protein [Basidiobolus meristosporus CBS 931.73]